MSLPQSLLLVVFVCFCALMLFQISDSVDSFLLVRMWFSQLLLPELLRLPDETADIITTTDSDSWGAQLLPISLEIQIGSTFVYLNFRNFNFCQPKPIKKD